MNRFTFEPTGARTFRVAVDGNEISRVKAVTVDAVAPELPEVVVTLAVTPSFQDVSATVYVDEATADALIAMGWTPPQDAQPGAESRT